MEEFEDWSVIEDKEEKLVNMLLFLENVNIGRKAIFWRKRCKAYSGLLNLRCILNIQKNSKHLNLLPLNIRGFLP